MSSRLDIGKITTVAVKDRRGLARTTSSAPGQCVARSTCLHRAGVRAHKKANYLETERRPLRLWRQVLARDHRQRLVLISSTPMRRCPMVPVGAPSAEAARDDRQDPRPRGNPRPFTFWDMAVRRPAGFFKRPPSVPSTCRLAICQRFGPQPPTSLWAARAPGRRVDRARPAHLGPRHGRLRQRRRWHSPSRGRSALLTRSLPVPPRGVSGGRAGRGGVVPPSRSATPPAYFRNREAVSPAASWPSRGWSASPVRSWRG